jgi:hypothetical protein
MDFVRSYFFTNEILGSWTLFSSKLDSPVIKTLETPSLNVKKFIIRPKSLKAINLNFCRIYSIEKLSIKAKKRKKKGT